MNKERRKILSDLSKTIKSIKEGMEEALLSFKDTLDQVKEDLNDAMGDEQEYFDNMPEGLQSGDKGATAEEAIQNMQSAVDALEKLESAIDELDGHLDTALEGIASAAGE